MSENTRLGSEQRETDGFRSILVSSFLPAQFFVSSSFVKDPLFAFVVIISLWFALNLHTLPQRRHPRLPRRIILLTAQFPVTTPARTSLQEQIPMRKVTHRGTNRPRTLRTHQPPPRRRFVPPHTDTHIIYILSRHAKSPHGHSSSITSYGCTPALALPRPAPSLS